MRLNKRGISPLIATVLIIGFTVALAAVILIWGQGFTKSMQQGAEESANINLMCANDVKFSVTGGCYCATANTIKVTVKNDGNIDIQNFTARFYKSPTQVGTDDTLLGLAKYGIKTYSVTTPVDVTKNAVKQIELIPVIKIDTVPAPITCSNTIEKYLDVDGVDTLQQCTPAC